MNGCAHIKRVHERTSEYWRGDTLCIRTYRPANPNKWIERMRLRLKQRKIKFTEQAQGDGVFFSW